MGWIECKCERETIYALGGDLPFANLDRRSPLPCRKSRWMQCNSWINRTLPLIVLQDNGTSFKTRIDSHLPWRDWLPQKVLKCACIFSFPSHQKMRPRVLDDGNFLNSGVVGDVEYDIFFLATFWTVITTLYISSDSLIFLTEFSFLAVLRFVLRHNFSSWEMFIFFLKWTCVKSRVTTRH